MPVLRLPHLPATAGKHTWGNLPGAALSLAIAEAASAAKRFTLLLTADSQSADRLEQELIGRPMSMRDALKTLRGLGDAHEDAQTLLRLLAQAVLPTLHHVAQHLQG